MILFVLVIILLVLIFFLFKKGAKVGRENNNTAPILIGLIVGLLLALLASITQVGMNPTRDFAPHLIAWMFGWRSAAFPDSDVRFFCEIYSFATCWWYSGWIFLYKNFRTSDEKTIRIKQIIHKNILLTKGES